MRLHAAIAIPLAAGVMASCSDGGTGTDGNVTMTLCAGSFFSWIGIQNEGQPWVEVTPRDDGTLNFEASEKVSIAFVIDFFGSTFTNVINATATELNGTSGEQCEFGEFGARAISGTVPGLVDPQSADISASFSTAAAFPGSPAFQLTELPDESTVDLVATRLVNPVIRDRIIIRRGLTPSANGLPAQTLDFAAAEARVLETASVSFTGITSGVLTAETVLGTDRGLGTIHALWFGSATAPPYTFTYSGTPATLRVTTDLHQLYANASAPETEREIFHYFAGVTDKTLAFGPDVGDPIIAILGGTPVRASASASSQVEYPTAFSADFTQETGAFSFKVVSVTTTAAFLGGTPATWEVEVPDFGNSGYQAEWGLGSGVVEWSVTAMSGDAGLMLGEPPADGTTLKFATRLSPGSALARRSVAGRKFMERGAWARARSK
jgi:hypothetical protein